jgi:cardiolipin synthase
VDDRAWRKAGFDQWTVMLRHLPNLLSGLRLLAAPLAAWAILAERDMAALVIFAGAGLSDFADGQIARRWGFVSRFGAWLDPIADKLLMLCAFLALLAVGAVPLWLVLLVIARDVAVAGGALLAKALALPLAVAPTVLGKATTAALIGYVCLVLLLLAADMEAPRLAKAGGYAVAGLVILSGLAYLQVFLRAVLSGRHVA